jgi:hypothetical protein
MKDNSGYADDEPIKGNKLKDEKQGITSNEPQLTIYSRASAVRSGFGNPIDWNGGI